MSLETQPISPARFALALQDLPIENLYSKAQEIENSIAHLQRSNDQLQHYSDSIRSDTTIDGQTRDEVGDRDCLDAIRENKTVIERQQERIELLKKEVERRGARWHGTPTDPKANGINGTNDSDAESNGGTAVIDHRSSRSMPQRLTDEELQRRLMERLAEDAADGGDGMHL